MKTIFKLTSINLESHLQEFLNSLYLLAVRFAVLFLAACGADYVADGNPTPGSDEPIDVYRDNCASCHGAEGNGTADAPQIREPVHAYATYVIRNGRASEMGFPQAMPAFAADEIPDLAPIFEVLDRTPRPTDGAGLYARFCGNCHGADASGGRVGESAKEDRGEIFEKVREGKGGSNFGARKKYMPAWTSSQLSDAEVELIAAYLATLPGGGDDGDDGDGDD